MHEKWMDFHAFWSRFEVVHCPLDLFFLLAAFERRPLPRNDPRAMAQIIRSCTPKALESCMWALKAIGKAMKTDEKRWKTIVFHLFSMVFPPVFHLVSIISHPFRSLASQVVDTAHLHGALGGFKRLGLTKFKEDAQQRYEELRAKGSVPAMSFRLLQETKSG